MNIILLAIALFLGVWLSFWQILNNVSVFWARLVGAIRNTEVHYFHSFMETGITIALVAVTILFIIWELI